jgi:hypothetical protein
MLVKRIYLTNTEVVLADQMQTDRCFHRQEGSTNKTYTDERIYADRGTYTEMYLKGRFAHKPILLAILL